MFKCLRDFEVILDVVQVKEESRDDVFVLFVQ